MPKINFFVQDTDFKLKNKQKIRQWLQSIVHQYQKSFAKEDDLNYIFCSDDYLHQINVDYLQHDTLTDVITFDNSEDEKCIAGDIFLSIERIQENAKNFGVSPQQELHRVMVHGLLHLLGFEDKSPQESQIMRQKENEHLSQLVL